VKIVFRSMGSLQSEMTSPTEPTVATSNEWRLNGLDHFVGIDVTFAGWL
jgi:hypothetical protein